MLMQTLTLCGAKLQGKKNHNQKLFSDIVKSAFHCDKTYTLVHQIQGSFQCLIPKYLHNVRHTRQNINLK